MATNYTRYYEDRIERDKLVDQRMVAGWKLAVLDAQADILRNDQVSDSVKEIVRNLIQYGKANVPDTRMYI